MNTMRVTDYNDSKTLNMALINGRYILAQRKRKGTISSKLVVFVLLALMLFACFGCGGTQVPPKALDYANKCTQEGSQVNIATTPKGVLVTCARNKHFIY